jgi:hypothetical protein
MAIELYKNSTNGSIQNIQLIYNFDNVSINAPMLSLILPNEELTNDPLTNIKSVFPLFNISDDYTTDNGVYNSFPINTRSDEQQISYSDNTTNGIIKYTIRYLHVGISPIEFGERFSIILEFTDSTGSILLIIFPLTLSTEESFIEEPWLKTMLENIDATTQTAFDIKKIIRPSQFNTYTTINTNTSNNNRVILFNNNSSIAYKTVPLFMTNISNNILTTTITFDLPPIIKSISNPQYKPGLLQNDIYIDCYKVGESDKIDGGIVNDAQSTIKNKSVSEQNKQNMIGLYLFGTLLGIGMLVALFFFISKGLFPKDEAAAVVAPQKINFKYEGFLYALGIIIFIFMLYVTIRVT